jgi:molybdate transport system ATP-binding protein
MISLVFKQHKGTFQLHINVQFPAKGMTVIFGHSGAGKTSLLEVIAGISKPDSGTIKIEDNILFDSEKSIFIPPEKRSIGYVFQDLRLFPHMTVRQNLLYGQPSPNPLLEEKILLLLGLKSLINRKPMTLSGGEKQRVAIARALLMQPSLLLMDEPFSSLDLPQKKELLPYINRMVKEIDIPLLYITHRLDEVIHQASFLMLLENGKVIEFGNKEEVIETSTIKKYLTKDSWET